MATINGDGSDNTLNGTGSADTITGFAGNDTINAGGGNDTIFGGGGTFVGTDLFLDWSAQGADEASIAGGFTQNTGGINVGVSFTNNGAGSTAQVETSTAGYVDTGEPFDANSHLELRGNGGATAWTTTLDFSAAAGSGFADNVQNVQFRLQDIDQSGWQDVVRVLAFDADGNAVDVTLTASGDDTVAGDTVTAGASSTTASNVLGSVLVNIAGPVAQVQIIYENLGTSAQMMMVSDIHFEAWPTDDDTIFGEGGNDTIDGGIGDDVIDGGSGADDIQGGQGNDTLLGGSGGDTLDGGDGADILEGGSGFDILIGGAGADTLRGGNGNDTIYANAGDIIAEGGEGGTDTADELIVDDVASVAFDPLNAENGTITFNDGSTMTFTGIEILTVNGGPDGIVQGTDGDDLIDATYVDPNLEMVDNNDGINGTTGDQDNIQAGQGDDTIFAGAADDVITAGDATQATADEVFSWVAQGGDGTDLSGGFTQDTGIAEITVTVTDNGGLDAAEVDARDQFVATGETFDANSSLLLDGSGAANVATVDFSSNNPLSNVSFRLNDIDSGGWQDVLTVNAFDADGNPVAVTFTPAGNDTVAGNTITAGPGGDNPDEAAGSVLVEIAGPVTRFEVVYQNNSTGGQIAFISDIHYTATDSDADTVFGGAGNDTIDGGAGDDILDGGTGNDIITTGLGADTVDGGDDRDTIYGSSGDFIDGGEGGDDFDRLILNDLGATITYDGGNPENGTVTFSDGSTLTFQNIERVIPCFTPGTLVRTNRGLKPVEDLVPGDLVATKDNGFQPVRWIGRKDLSFAQLLAAPHLCPIRMAKDALGPAQPNRAMMVSPQHRMLIESEATQLWMGVDGALVRAKHLTHKPGIDQVRPRGGVSYIHVLFDAHEVILADGTWTESFQPGDLTLEGNEAEMFLELFEIFPELRTPEGRAAWGDAARVSAKAHEALVIA